MGFLAFRESPILIVLLETDASQGNPPPLRWRLVVLMCACPGPGLSVSVFHLEIPHSPHLVKCSVWTSE